MLFNQIWKILNKHEKVRQILRRAEIFVQFKYTANQGPLNALSIYNKIYYMILLMLKRGYRRLLKFILYIGFILFVFPLIQKEFYFSLNFYFSCCSLASFYVFLTNSCIFYICFCPAAIIFLFDKKVL